jgi:hypothetical protein
VSALKRSAHKIARKFGYDIVSSASARPAICGSEAILGSFPPFNQYFAVGRRENYFIHNGYEARSENAFYDDTANSDQWQREVYQFAREVCDRDALRSVCDIGCGSAFKLLTYFEDLETVGIDLPATLNFLRQQWPDRVWMDANYEVMPPMSAQMVIACDVIEHLNNPDHLLAYIAEINPAKIVLSTPDRNLLRRGTHNGPPGNLAHCREWGFAEFHAYVAHWFDIEDHFISSAAQCTQCVLCKPRC